MRRARLVLLCCVIAALAFVRAAEPHEVPRIDGVISVDGRLDEPFWFKALELTLEFETSPGENVAPPVRTVCYFAFDESHLLVGCRADDPDPARIRARYADRDSAFSDDFIGVILDTFNDERRAYEFLVNPLGVQMDLIQDDVAGREDSSWDGIWHSAGRMTDSGYEIELAIPFSTLRFQRGAARQTWGLDVVRNYPRDRRVRIGLHPLKRDTSCYLCQATKISGFAGVRPGRNLEVVPTLTVTRSDSVENFPDGGLTRRESDYEPGLTVEWGVTPSLTLSATANPDFSQVEADVARLEVNEQFALFFPEKRPFFLEGADYFDTSIDAVHTRTVADPDWGAKLTGKEGRNAFGAFLAQDSLTQLLFPGSQGSSLGALDQDARAGVFRYRRDLGQASAIGGLVTVRDNADYANSVFGVDALVRPTDADTLRVQALRSRTEYPAPIAQTFAQPDGAFEDNALELSYRHSPRDWTVRLNYADYGDGFRSDLGFVPRVDYSQWIVGGEYRWYAADDRWYSRIWLGGDWDETRDQRGNLIEREIEGWWQFSGPWQSFFFVGSGHRTRVFNEVRFSQTFYSTFFEFSPTGDWYANISLDYGDQVDFAFAPQLGQARQGRSVQVAPGLRRDFGRHLRLNVNHVLRRLELPEGRLFRANLTETRLVYQLNVRAFLRLITQYGALRFDEQLAQRPPRQRDLFNQFLFSYKLNAETALFIGYTDARADLFDGMVADDLVPTGRTLFVKLGYAWMP